LALAVWFHKNAKGELWLEQLCQFHKKLTLPHMTHLAIGVLQKKTKFIIHPILRNCGTDHSVSGCSRVVRALDY
jgi:hypothetical protein